jgi:hypothetical protein
MKTHEFKISTTEPPELLKATTCAKWIWTDDDPNQPNVWIYARRTFEVQNLDQGCLYITADLRYLVWVNGVQVGFGPPKYYIKCPTVDRYPITEYLRPGRNVVAVRVFSMGDWNHIASCMPRRGSLLAAIEVDGQIIPTDSRWKTHREKGYRDYAVHRAENQPHNEVFDDRIALYKPWRPEFDDDDWAAATELSDGPVLEPWTGLELRDIPLFSWQRRDFERVVETGLAAFDASLNREIIDGLDRQITDAVRRPNNESRIIWNARSNVITLDGRNLTTHDGCYVRWDFGRIWTGYPVIEVTGDPGTVIDISYAEHLTGGTVDPTKNGLFYLDRLILGDRSLHHRITWPKCLRYLQADVRGGNASFTAVGMEVSTYPVERRGAFHSSDSVLDQAWEISAHTLQLCMEDNYMDTPWRERGSWLGDVAPQALANYYTFGDTALIRRFLRLHALGQLPDGAMSGKYPGNVTSHVWTWTLTFATILNAYYRFTGDRNLVRDLWPACKKNVEWLERYRWPQGVYGGLPLKVTKTENFYTFIDWSPINTSGANAAFNAFAYAFLTDLAHLAEAIGEPDDQNRFETMASELKQTFRRLFWDSNRGIFVNGFANGQPVHRWGCQENYLALVFGLADEDQRKSIINRLKQEDLLATFEADPACYDEPLASMAIALNTYRWNDKLMVPLGTPYFAGWALQAMCEGGMTLESLEMIRYHWGNFSRQGGTTVWETWDKQCSLSHAWGASPIFVLGRYILGVNHLLGDPRCVEVLPNRADLSWAKGRVPTRMGIIDIAWTWGPDWSLEVTVPEGCRAVVGLPASDIHELILDGQAVESPRRINRGGDPYLAAEVSGGRHVCCGTRRVSRAADYPEKVQNHA